VTEDDLWTPRELNEHGEVDEEGEVDVGACEGEWSKQRVQVTPFALDL
jgi:hypothetical protein